MQERKIVERIIDLSAQALSEKDRGEFVRRLKERSALLSQVIDKDIEVGVHTLGLWLEKEQELSARLEEERRRVLRDMDTLSAKRRAIRQYSPKFPFPPMPAFFDKIG